MKHRKIISSCFDAFPTPDRRLLRLEALGAAADGDGVYCFRFIARRHATQKSAERLFFRHGRKVDS
ncbi:hypothetical protein C5689_04000 [Methylosinus sporium]|uniref:Uncharacterized protein n=1 Tax=Methylosinus sporium TaxID=428 RepID=A0A2U1SUM6_METSR|nr:hypothetical protein C5689_04000 [Methylosinus sporium]